jgi:hypothetical protein
MEEAGRDIIAEQNRRGWERYNFLIKWKRLGEIIAE